MRLTRIEIHGFKSFADRTALDLPPGLTAIVGPNGCGKSNVIDAVKWALGEQRASALRGKDMLDVVFKGNGARAQRNFAEVSLLFDNSDGVMATDYTEVVLTRRLFRSGESEYLLNRQPARLKDIRDLLLDTGLGASAYSVMEQGRIDAVLSANAQERRRIFEEAAGISRYRARRRESESKLARTEQNLLRLGDVVEELEKRQRSLKVQAGRARTFVAARDRSRKLRSLFFRHQWDTLGEQLQRQDDEEKLLADTERQARGELERARLTVSTCQEQLTTVRAEVDEISELFRQATGEVEALTERQSALHERVEDIAERRQLLEGRILALQRALAQRREEVEGVDRRLLEVSEEASRWRCLVDERAAVHGVAEEALAAWTRSTEERREAALVRVGTLTECRNRRSAAASRHAGLTASRDHLAERLVVLDGELQKLLSQQQELFATARGLDSEVERTGAELGTRLDVEQRLGAELAALDGRLQGVREELAAATSRREALNELIQRRDGVAPGAVSLLESGLDGLDGLLIDHVSVPRGLAEAVEAALGSSTQALVVSSRVRGLAALEHIASVDGGRVSLIPADALSPRKGAAAGSRLLDELQVSAHHDVFEALLSHVRLLPDRAALEAAAVDGVTVWVTPAGDLLDEQGVLCGGAAGKEGGLVARRAELAELVENCAALEAELTAAVEQRVSVLEQLHHAREQVVASRNLLREFEAERERALEAERQGSVRRQALERERTLRAGELKSMAAELTEVSAQLDEATQKEADLEAAVASDREEEAREELRHRELQSTCLASQEALSAARLEHSTRRERQEALESERRQVQRGAEERREEVERAQAELEGLLGLRTGMEQKLVALEQRSNELTEQRDGRAGVLNEARERSRKVAAELELAQHQVTDREGSAEARARELADHRLASRETAIRRDELHQKVLEDLEIDLAENEDPGPGQDAGQSDSEESDWQAIAAEIDLLREKLGRMVNVNLAAVEELADVEERLTFMVTQRDDLIGARQSLAETINKLNRESRERFVEAFGEVREHFRAIFRKLFQGGKADIALEEGVDVLEAGINITAAPPGKDPRNITLLSGGERTLTAVGLLFALFRSRPSPVCLLDEVDAALDETNIDRFCSVLEDFLGESQFLVVTHARRTMSYADQVFGVTMQEHGVSKVLSLTIDEYESHGAAGNGSARRIEGQAVRPKVSSPEAGSGEAVTDAPMAGEKASASHGVLRQEVREAMEADGTAGEH